MSIEFEDKEESISGDKQEEEERQKDIDGTIGAGMTDPEERLFVLSHEFLNEVLTLCSRRVALTSQYGFTAENVDMQLAAERVAQAAVLRLVAAAAFRLSCEELFSPDGSTEVTEEQRQLLDARVLQLSDHLNEHLTLVHTDIGQLYVFTKKAYPHPSEKTKPTH